MGRRKAIGVASKLIRQLALLLTTLVHGTRRDTALVEGPGLEARPHLAQFWPIEDVSGRQSRPNFILSYRGMGQDLAEGLLTHG